MLPKLSGIELCRRIRKNKEHKNIPIIMLTAKGEEEDKLRGLATGADDYITKPFSVNEIVARVKTVLRRIRPMFVDEVLTYKGIVIDLVSHSASRDGETLHLGPTEFNLLAFFMENIGRVFNCKTVQDAWSRPVLLFKNDWNLNQLLEDHSDLKLSSVAPVVSGGEPINL